MAIGPCWRARRIRSCAWSGVSACSQAMVGRSASITASMVMVLTIWRLRPEKIGRRSYFAPQGIVDIRACADVLPLATPDLRGFADVFTHPFAAPWLA